MILPRKSRHQAAAPFLALTQKTNLSLLVSAIEPPWRQSGGLSWYWQRGWIEQSFKDAKSLFGLARVQVRSLERLCRLLMALTVALLWLSLMGLPEVGAMPRRWHASVVQRGRTSLTSLALALLDELGDLTPSCLPRPSSPSA